jgi:hypothetical protein
MPKVFRSAPLRAEVAFSRQLRFRLTTQTYSESERCLVGSGDQQATTRAMVANTHNPAPAIAHDSPM